jgi:hypothetical protein
MSDPDPRIDEALRRAYSEASLAWPPERDGPTPLDKLIGDLTLYHEEVRELTRTRAIERLLATGIARPDVQPDETPLAGFIVVTGASGAVFVRREDNLARRRFSAAHELGHFLMHVEPEQLDFVMQDTTAAMIEPSVEDDWLELNAREREANRFAAELLMPEPVVRRLCVGYARRHRPTEQFLANHLATDLLVSRTAARWRLRELRLV